MIVLTLYRLLWWVLLPIIIVTRLFRDWRSPLGVRSFLHRFGFHKLSAADLVIHAVSLGEVRAVTPLVRRLLQEKQCSILFTATTLTGSDQIIRTFKKEIASGALYHSYLPLDFGPSVSRFLAQVKPKAILIMETEIWPNLIYQAGKRHIPLLIISACLSDRSYRRYQKIAPAMHGLLKSVDVLTQTDEDTLRFEVLGARSVERMGNIKYDLTVSDTLYQKVEPLVAHRSPHSIYWIAASTHEEEEEIVVEAYIKARRRAPHLKLILVPRHPERFQEVRYLLEEYADAHDFKLSIRSERDLLTLNPNADIWLIDTLGELLLFYLFADIVTVGGSFVPIGGHNILEPAYFAKPIIVGPHMEENRETLFNFLESRALIQVDADQLAEVVVDFANDSSLRESYGAAAQKTMAQNQGAIEVVMAKLNELLD
ncbi:3-deoxy-D-manno-octulosonic acid transferase [Ignatzschineria indica]|uniref:3-deoxy-D-manno-octulosonic acid transferase n=1 Tax=Ignatzschineria indica TaxID=472583 RepID=UPI0025769D1E|nr:3-deoxy-D-manno-octulosonic acid transferase [Ignatzschineria indica]MDM1544389.1 3-deoxy-D-manno-octulosonic acid transferase [Ignatzschineria indica]